MIIEAGEPDAVCIPRLPPLRMGLRMRSSRPPVAQAHPRHAVPALVRLRHRAPRKHGVPSGARRGVSRRGGNPRPTLPTRLSSEEE